MNWPLVFTSGAVGRGQRGQGKQGDGQEGLHRAVRHGRRSRNGADEVGKCIEIASKQGILDKER